MILRRHPHTIWLIGQDRHLGFFRPSAPGGTYSGWGFHYRRREAPEQWFQLHLKLHMKPKSRERREFAGTRGWRLYELSSCRSRTPTNTDKSRGNRLNYKSYVRLKVCPGGKRPVKLAEHIEGAD